MLTFRPLERYVGVRICCWPCLSGNPGCNGAFNKLWSGQRHQQASRVSLKAPQPTGEHDFCSWVMQVTRRVWHNPIADSYQHPLLQTSGDRGALYGSIIADAFRRVCDSVLYATHLMNVIMLIDSKRPKPKYSLERSLKLRIRVSENSFGVIVASLKAYLIGRRRCKSISFVVQRTASNWGTTLASPLQFGIPVFVWR